MDSVKVRIEIRGTYAGQEFSIVHDSDVALAHRTDPEVSRSPSVKFQMTEIRTCEAASHLAKCSTDQGLWMMLRAMFARAFDTTAPDGGKK